MDKAQAFSAQYRRCSFLGKGHATHSYDGSLNYDSRYEGWFHCWAGTSELAYAIVELDDGRVVRVTADEIVFEPVELEQ